MDLLTDVNNTIVDNEILNFLILSEKLSESWLEVNKCRVFTESIVDYEELLIPSMGLINDAKCMLESLVAWKLGMTLYGKWNILQCIRMAGLEHINPMIGELEFWLDWVDKYGDTNDLIQCVAF